MARYDDWVYDRGLENEGWVHDRWGDDDDDDWDDCCGGGIPETKKEEKKMKTFFTKIGIPRYASSYMEVGLKRIKEVLDCPNIIAMNSKDGASYTVYIQDDIRNLAGAFGIDLSDAACENIMEAVRKTEDYARIIQTDLFFCIEQFLKEEKSFNNGDISFLMPCSDMQALNSMASALNESFEIKTFEQFSALCRNMSLNLDISDLVQKRDEKIKERDETRFSPKKESLDKQVNLAHSRITRIKNASCYSRETFAMLYVRLENYVAYEKAVNHFHELMKTGNFSSRVVED